MNTSAEGADCFEVSWEREIVPGQGNIYRPELFFCFFWFSGGLPWDECRKIVKVKVTTNKTQASASC